MRVENKELAVGQIWADQRHTGRTVKVLGFDERHVYVATITPSRAARDKTIRRKSRILRRDFKPGAQGYSYVRG